MGSRFSHVSVHLAVHRGTVGYSHPRPVSRTTSIFGMSHSHFLGYLWYWTPIPAWSKVSCCKSALWRTGCWKVLVISCHHGSLINTIQMAVGHTQPSKKWPMPNHPRHGQQKNICSFTAISIPDFCHWSLITPIVTGTSLQTRIHLWKTGCTTFLLLGPYAYQYLLVITQSIVTVTGMSDPIATL